jgi:hypothetical protein
VFDVRAGLRDRCETADSLVWMPSPVSEMDVARIAVREQRAGLLAGSALTVVALGLLVFAVVAWMRTPAERTDVARAVRVSAVPASPAPVQAAAGADAPAALAGTGHAAAGPAGASRSRRIDHLPITAQSASRFMPLYRRAAKTFGVNWRLIASIHQQETSFSSAPGTYRGLNFARCCAGPMQFNVTNGPVSTWERFRDAYRGAARPALYPHRTHTHPSVYDDFDAVMAAGALLRADGAGRHLDGSAWLAAYHYYGHDLTGLQYADQVLARAVGWAQRGVCAECGVDPGLTARFDAAFAAPFRAELLAAERHARAEARERVRRERAGRRRTAARREAERRSRAGEAKPDKSTTAARKASGVGSGTSSPSNGASAQPATTSG